MTESATTGPIGDVVIEGDRATLVFQRRLDHPPEAVWQALTDPAHLAGWYMARGSLEPWTGGTVEFRSGPSQLHITGQVLVWDPPRLLEHEWKVEPGPGLPEGEDAVIRWQLDPDGSGTLLRLTHRQLRRTTALGFAPGTHAFLDRLEAHLSGDPLPNWQERYTSVAGHYPPSWIPR